MKQKMLLHVCCAPCSSSVLERLVEEFDVTIHYYNPNIYPESEYDMRDRELHEFVKKAYDGNIPIISEKYDHNEYLDVISGLENEKEGGKRCEKCFRLRLRKTAELAKSKGFDIFTTTLSVSPYKNFRLLNEIGFALQDELGIQYYEANFKKKNGYLRSVILSKEYGLYRQDYCGCEFSRRNKIDE